MSNGFQSAQEFETQDETFIEEPGMYNVIMINDDYTTMEFVVHILKELFHLDGNSAVEIMQTIHLKGKAIVGTYIYDIAITKTVQVQEMARQNNFPLLCKVEEVL